MKEDVSLHVEALKISSNEEKYFLDIAKPPTSNIVPMNNYSDTDLE